MTVNGTQNGAAYDGGFVCNATQTQGVPLLHLPMHSGDAREYEFGASSAPRGVRRRGRADPWTSRMEGAVAKAREIAQRTPGAFMPQQFDNPANPRAHAESTAREIIDAMRPLRIDALVVGVGTGGTISGVGEVLRRELSPAPRIIGVEPESCATISRGERGPTKIQGLAAGFIPKNYHSSVVDEMRTVADADAWRTKVLLARREGLLVGISAVRPCTPRWRSLANLVRGETS